MHNPDRTLTRSEAANTATRYRQLRPLLGKPVRVEYVKRDGSPSVSEGPLDTLVIKGSKGHVVIDTTASKGRPSTVNLWGITKVTSL